MKHLRLLAVALCLIAYTPIDLLAQDPPNMIHITRVKIKPDAVESYLKLLKEEVLPAYKKTDMQWIDAWEVFPYGDGAQFAFASEIKSFAMWDEAHPLLKVLGADGAMSLVAKLRQHAVSTNLSAYMVENDHSYRSNGEAKAAVLWEADVTPGNHDRAMHWIKADLLPAMKKGGVVNFLVHSQLFGSSADLMAVVMLKDFADLDNKHPVYRVHEPEEAKAIMARGEPLFSNDTTITLRRLPELSFNKAE